MGKNLLYSALLLGGLFIVWVRRQVSAPDEEARDRRRQRQRRRVPRLAVHERTA